VGPKADVQGGAKFKIFAPAGVAALDQKRLSALREILGEEPRHQLPFPVAGWSSKYMTLTLKKVRFGRAPIIG
jgi:hypothetical protein